MYNKEIAKCVAWEITSGNALTSAASGDTVQHLLLAVVIDALQCLVIPSCISRHFPNMVTDKRKGLLPHKF